MIPSTLTDIANQALSIIGHKFITNIDANGSPENTVRELLGQTISEVENLINWPELQVRLKPSLQSTDPDTNEKTYNLPSNFMQILKVNKDFDPLSEHWRIEAGKLKTGLEVEELMYKRFSEEPTEWGEDLRELVICALAAKIVMPLLQSTELAAYYRQMYETKRNKATCRAKNRARKLETRDRFYRNNRSRLAYGQSGLSGNRTHLR